MADVTEAGVGADGQISDAKRKSRLTTAQVKNLPPGRYHDSGGTGLHDAAEPSTSRSKIHGSNHPSVQLRAAYELPFSVSTIKGMI